MRQTTMNQPRRKRIWQQIVRAKIRAQAGLLREVQGDDYGLLALLKHVGSGDPANVEARAARRYWLLLFGDVPFARSNDDDVRNHWLNYGYAVLRSATARALCASGLHPTFGLAHHNQANAFALADDLMEPFRPIIDRIVASQEARPLDTEGKKLLISSVCDRYIVENECRTLFDILARVAQSLARVVMREADELWLPDWKPQSAQ